MRILITGATGLVGQGVLRACLDAADVSEVVALGRSPSGASDAKLTDLVCQDFMDLSPIEARLQPFDACLYCAGAQMLGMSQARFREVTLDTTVHVASALARLNPDLVFAYISGAGSDPGSRVFPLRVKGDTERALQALPLRTVMLRPGGIQPVGGERSPHGALAAVYAITGPLMGLAVKAMPKWMTTTQCVGRAMLAAVRATPPPAVVENDEINRIGAAAS